VDQLPTADLAMGNALFTQVPNRSSDTSPTAVAALISQPWLSSNCWTLSQYCSVTEANGVPVGTSSYNAMQVTYTHRWHAGLNVNVSYTYSKFTDDVQGASGWAFPGSGSNVRDFHNLGAERSRMSATSPTAWS